MNFAGEWLKLGNATERTSVYIDFKKARDISMIRRNKRKTFRRRVGKAKEYISYESSRGYARERRVGQSGAAEDEWCQPKLNMYENAIKKPFYL